jgi:hypothetical protein
MNRISTLALLALSLTLTACDRSPATPPGPSATTQEQIKQDLKTAGEKVKETAGKAAKEADPALQKAKEDAQDLLHKAAEKVADQTAPTQPATIP